MPEPIVYLNGETLPLSEAKLSIFDLGLVLGASVTELIRAFGHRPFRAEEHLSRLFRSLKAVGFNINESPEELRATIEQVVGENGPLIPEGHDLGIVLFVTAGLNPTYVGAAGMKDAGQSTVCVHTFPLPFELWAEKFEAGQHLITPSIRHIPPASLDPKIKTRSRMHWYLAEQQAKLVEPGAGALVLDNDGHICETSTGNFFLVSDGVLLTPRPDRTLGGISQLVALELAEMLGIEHRAVDITPYDVVNAEEAFTS